MVYRGRSGLSLIETLISLMIMGIVMTTIVGLQTKLLRSVFSAHDVLVRMAALVNGSEELGKKAEENDRNEPAIQIEKQVKDAEEHPRLKKFSHLKMIRISGTWSTAVGTHSETFVTFAFEPEGTT